MSQQIQFSLDDLKLHPEYAVFAMALEERLKESEVRRRNISFALIGVSIPIMLSIGAGIYGLADTAINTRIDGAKSEFLAQLPRIVDEEVGKAIDETFETALVAKISSRSLAQARKSYELAAALAQLNATATRIEVGEGFTESEAELALSSLVVAVKQGSLDESLTRDATLRSGAQLAQSFASAQRPDLLVRVADAIGIQSALTSDEVSVATVSAIGQTLVGSLEDPQLWPTGNVSLFDAAVRQLSARPELAREWEIAVAYRKAVDDPDSGYSEKVEALLSDTVALRDGLVAGRVLANIGILTEPAVYTRNGEANMDAQDFRIQSLMTDFFDKFAEPLAAILDSRQARDSVREVMIKVVELYSSDEVGALKRFFWRMCNLDERLCSVDESPAVAGVAIELSRR